MLPVQTAWNQIFGIVSLVEGSVFFNIQKMYLYLIVIFVKVLILLQSSSLIAFADHSVSPYQFTKLEAWSSLNSLKSKRSMMNFRCVLLKTAASSWLLGQPFLVFNHITETS